jgi:membrane protein
LLRGTVEKKFHGGSRVSVSRRASLGNRVRELSYCAMPRVVEHQIGQWLCRSGYCHHTGIIGFEPNINMEQASRSFPTEWHARLARALTRLHDIRAALVFAWKRLGEERLGDVAGSLTFTTVLSLVPLLTVALALFTAFPLFEQFRINLQQYFIANLMPDSISKAVLNYLNQFSTRAKGLSAVGGVFLLITSIMLLATIDRAFNTIWRVRTQRKLVQRLISYWTIITAGPLLIGASLTLSSKLIKDAGNDNGFFGDLLVDSIPLFLSAAAFSLLYKTLPSKPVRWSDAFAGGFLAGLAFEIAKRLFALFIAKFPTYTAVYGAFAAVPIFLIWVYLSWIITLLGAVVCATLPILKYERWRRRPLSGEHFVDALSILQMLSEVRIAKPGHSASVSARDIRQRTQLGYAEAEALLERMVAAGWVGKLEEEAPRFEQGAGPVVADRVRKAMDEGMSRWAMIVDPSALRVGEVFRLFALEASLRPGATSVLKRAGKAIDDELDETLSQHFAARTGT